MDTDCCFKCGKIGHHRQSCSTRVNQSDEYMISRLCKRMHKEATQPTETMKRVHVDLTRFPVLVLENALATSSNFYFNKLSEVLEAGQPGLDVPETQLLKIAHHDLNMKILSFRKSDEDLAYYCKKRLLGQFLTANEKDEFSFKLEDYSSIRHQVYMESNKLTLWCVNAVASSVVFWNMDNKIKTWLNTTFNDLGRPTIQDIHSLNTKIVEYDRKLGVMARESRNLRNICNSGAANTLMKVLNRTQRQLSVMRQRINAVEVKQKEELTKEQLEKEQRSLLREITQKLMCILCQDSEKQWALRCGHMYCTSCINHLQQDRTTEGIPWVDEETGEERVLQHVPLPKECAFCKGTLSGKIKLFFL